MSDGVELELSVEKKGDQKHSLDLPEDVTFDFTTEDDKHSAWSKRTLDCYAEYSIKSEGSWLVDSACSRHMTGNASLLRDIEPIFDCKVRFGDGSRISAIGEGILDFKYGQFKVLYVPGLKVNLLSVPQLLETGFDAIFRCNAQSYIETSGCRIPIIKHGKLLKLDLQNEELINNMEVDEEVKVLTEWHIRLGHIDQLVLRQYLIKKGKLPEKCKAKIAFCNVCAEAKLTQKKSERRLVYAQEILGRLHTDINGPLDLSWDGYTYFVNVVDESSRYAQVSRLRHKSTAGTELQRICKELMATTNKSVSVVRSDGGGEFESINMKEFYKAHGIRHEPVPAYTPSMNGLAERLNRTLMEKVRCLLFTARLSMRFWPEALDYATYLYNRSPHRALKYETPLEKFTGDSRELQLDKLHTFGSVGYYCVPSDHRSKLQPMGLRCLFLGMSSTAYLVLTIPDLEVKQVRTIRVNDGVFLSSEELTQLGIGKTDALEQRSLNMDGYDSPFEQDGDSNSQPSNLKIPGNKGASKEPSSSAPTISKFSLSSFNKASSSKATESDSSKTTVKDSPHTSVDFKGDKDDNSDDSSFKVQESDASREDCDNNDEDSSGLESNILEQVNFATEALDETDVCYLTEEAEYVSKEAGLVHALDYLVKKELKTSRLSSKCALRSKHELLCYHTSIEPRSHNDALKDPKWIESMHAELDSLKENETWTLEFLPKGRTAIGSKWVFKVKTDGRYKSRLVGVGCSQKAGIDFEETWSPVGRKASLKAIVKFVTQNKWKWKQMDVDTAFLYSVLQEEIYMRQPPGFDDKSGRVCRLRKSIYGLKQANREWYKTLSDFLLSVGFKRSEVDPCVYLKKSTILFVYVDDMIIAGETDTEVEQVSNALKSRFKMKDLGEPQRILGIELKSYKDGIIMTSEAYIQELLDQYQMQGCRPVATPMDSNTVFVSRENSKATPEDVRRYQSLIGSLLYAANTTRPDIAYTVSMLSQFLMNPSDEHWRGAKRLLRYLKGTKDVGLFFGYDSEVKFNGYSRGIKGAKLSGFTDSDFASCITRRSRSGYAFYYGSSLISWMSKKQSLIALSTCEAEYYALTEGGKEAIHLRRLLWELQNQSPYSQDTVSEALIIYCDNQSAITVAKDPAEHKVMKHVDLRYKWIQERVGAGDFKVDYVPTTEQVADIFTKPLGRPQFEKLREKLGMFHSTS